MAKRKSKKVKSSINFKPLVIGVLFVVAIIMMLLPFVNYSASANFGKTELAGIRYSISGFVMAFGGDVTYSTSGVFGSSTATAEFEMVTVALIAFICLAVGVVCSLVGLVPMKKEFKPVYLVLAVLGLAACVLVFITMPCFFTLNEIAEESQAYYAMGVGTFLSGGIAGVGALASGYFAFSK